MILKTSKVKVIKMSLYRLCYRYERKEKFVAPKMKREGKKTKEKKKADAKQFDQSIVQWNEIAAAIV